MGQYYLVVNITKKQFIEPHRFHDGANLREFGASGGGTMFALAALLSNGNGRGDGDLSENPIIGSWAGDQIVVAGDYADEGVFLDKKDLKAWRKHCQKEGILKETPNLNTFASALFEDISMKILPLLR